MPWKQNAVLAATLLAAVLPAAAQERAQWNARSRNAIAITGDVSLSETKLTMDFISYPSAEIRDLDPTEVASVFDVDTAKAGKGTLYRVGIPAAQKFVRGNTLCGTQDVIWFAAYATPGRHGTLQLAFFSGNKPPEFTAQAISNSPNLCGIFSYSK